MIVLRGKRALIKQYLVRRIITETVHATPRTHRKLRSVQLKVRLQYMDVTSARARISERDALFALHVKERLKRR